MSLFKNTRSTSFYLDGGFPRKEAVRQKVVLEGKFEQAQQTEREYTRDPFEAGLKPLLPSTLDGLNEIILADQMTCPHCRKTVNRDKHSDPFICECGWRSE